MTRMVVRDQDLIGEWYLTDFGKVVQLLNVYSNQPLHL